VYSSTNWSRWNTCLPSSWIASWHATVNSCSRRGIDNLMTVQHCVHIKSTIQLV
jgi:hypothetical protein